VCGASVEALAVASPQDRSFAPFADGEIDGACRAWNEWDGGGLAAFPEDLEGSVAALEAQILDVGLACLGDAKPVEAEQYSQRGVVAVEAFGGEQEHTELAAIQTSRLRRMDLWSSDGLGRVGTDDPVDVREQSPSPATIASTWLTPTTPTGRARRSR